MTTGAPPVYLVNGNGVEQSMIDHFPHANLGAFGDLETMPMTPVCHLSFVTGTRSQLLSSTTANSATVDTNGGRLRLQSGTYAAISGTTADEGVTLTSAQSVVSRDTAGTTITGGDVLWNGMFFNDSSGIINLTDHEIFIAPGEVLTISGTATNSATLGGAVNWVEDVQ